MKSKQERLSSLEQIAQKVDEDSTHARDVEEIEEWFKCRVAEYNSPSATAERQARYEQICGAGERLRKQMNSGE
jgi:hypothetical protein